MPSADSGPERDPRDDATATGAITDADLHRSVAPHHRRLDAAQWNDIYVIGDVHGCIDELRTLVDTIGPDADDLLLFVGDLVMKGPDSAAVVSYVRERENALSIRGNQEAKLLDERKSHADIDEAALAYLETFPVAVSWDQSLLVHGGIDPRRPLREQDRESLLTFRSVPPENGYAGPFWFEQYVGPPTVLFGHTVLDAPVDTGSAIGLDTGCVYGGALTAYDYRRGRFTSVPAEATYETRADRKIVDPSATSTPDR